MLDRRLNVAVIGGGNGSAIVINGLKQNAAIFDISAIISMSDSGGSSGRLRQELGVLPPGDILRAVLALSKHDYRMLKEMFYSIRFRGAGKLNWHNAGNLFLALSSKYGNSFVDSVRALEESVQAVGRAHPATLKSADLAVELSDGSLIRAEAAIDKPNYNRSLKIQKIWLEPEAPAYEGALQEINSADAIVLSPGDLHTSIIAALLPKGIREAIGASRALLLYVAGDAYHADGETGPECLSGFVNTLERYLPRHVDIVLYNNHELSKEESDFYNEKKWARIDFDLRNLRGRDVRGFDFSRGKGLCPVKLGRILKEIIMNNKIQTANVKSMSNIKDVETLA